MAAPPAVSIAVVHRIIRPDDRMVLLSILFPETAVAPIADATYEFSGVYESFAASSTPARASHLWMIPARSQRWHILPKRGSSGLLVKNWTPWSDHQPNPC